MYKYGEGRCSVIYTKYLQCTFWVWQYWKGGGKTLTYGEKGALSLKKKKRLWMIALTCTHGWGADLKWKPLFN